MKIEAQNPNRYGWPKEELDPSKPIINVESKNIKQKRRTTIRGFSETVEVNMNLAMN